MTSSRWALNSLREAWGKPQDSHSPSCHAHSHTGAGKQACTPTLIINTTCQLVVLYKEEKHSSHTLSSFCTHQKHTHTHTHTHTLTCQNWASTNLTHILQLDQRKFKNKKMWQITHWKTTNNTTKPKMDEEQNQFSGSANSSRRVLLLWTVS